MKVVIIDETKGDTMPTDAVEPIAEANHVLRIQQDGHVTVESKNGSKIEATYFRALTEAETSLAKAHEQLALREKMKSKADQREAEDPVKTKFARVWSE